MQQSSQDQQLSVGNFSEDDSDPEESLILDQEEPTSEGFWQQGGGSIQLIYTMFSLYRKELNQLAQKYQCKFKFSISAYIVEQAKGHNKQSFLECLRQAESFMKSINMVEITHFFTQAQKSRFINSLYIQEVLQSKKIRLIYFQKKLFGVSRHLQTQALKKQLINVVKSILVFSICLKRVRRKQSHWGKIYNHITQFMKLIFIYNQKFFKERNIDVRLNKKETFIMIHGQKSKFLMEAKLTVKNVLESMICLFVKGTPIDHQHMKKYLSKAALFPVYYTQYNKSVSMIITKDNVLRQLIQKSPYFLKYLGIQVQSEESVEHKPQVGFYFLPSLSINKKIGKIKEQLQQRCYDIESQGGIRYLKRIYSQKGEQPKNIIRELMIKVIHCIEQNKIKFQILRELRPQPERKISQKDDGLKYQAISGKQQEKQISKLLRRDVLSEKVQMKKKYIIAYNVLETPEQVAYWVVDKNGQEQQEVKVQELRKGTFMKGLKKKDNNGETVKLFQQLLTVL